MATATLDVFLRRLAASQLLDADTLAACRSAAEASEDGLTETQLLEYGLTRFQIRQLRAGATNFYIGKYVITDCVGRGGNGIVFKARHRLMRRDVALKTLDTRSLHHAKDAVARFKREIEIVGQLEHVNVVRALDVLQTRTHTYLVLEFVAGQDLAAVVKQRGPLPIHEAVDYALQAARGLQYAHGQGIIHRDLKPENLLLTRDGTVKVSDLGLARFFEDKEDAELTVKGMCLGTPEYMAPEQAEDAQSVDLRSDIYSLGATLFHLLTGQLPVQGKSYLHRLQHLLTAPPRPLRDARPDAPPDLAAIVDQMRARDPAARPATAEEVIRLLGPFARQSLDEDPNDWSPRRKADLVLQVLSSQIPAETICASQGVRMADFSRWRDVFIEGGIRALGPTPNPEDSSAKIGDLLAKIGMQAMEIETLRKPH
jgi:eukaryotic-like serine/threonine-protein kinase